MSYPPGSACRTLFSAAVLSALVICSWSLPCVAAPAKGVGRPAAPSPLTAPTLDELKHATYTGIGTTPVKLNRGIFEGPPYVPGGASRQRIELLDGAPVTADLNGDGASESVVFLAEENGGTATFLYMAVMGRADGKIVTLATARLGDRVSVRSVQADKGEISVELLQFGPRDPACCPSELVTRTWSLERSGLSERPGRGRPSTMKLSTLEGVTWLFRGFDTRQTEPSAAVTLLFDAERISGSAGCNRYVGVVTPGKGTGEVALSASKSTNSSCGTAAMALEEQYLEALRRTVRYGFYLGDLTLTWQQRDGSTKVMRFAPRKPAAE